MVSKMEARLGFFWALAAAVLIVVGVMSYQKIRGLIEANRQVAQTNEVLTEVSAVRAAIQGAQNMANDYVITQERRFQDQYYSAISQAQRALDRLRMLTAHEPDQ